MEKIEERRGQEVTEAPEEKTTESILEGQVVNYANCFFKIHET